MEVPDLISKEVWDLAAEAFRNKEHFVTYNNTLLFIHPDDICFFTNAEDANVFCENNFSDRDTWCVVRIENLTQFKETVEKIIPGIEYKPIEPVVVVNEPQQSYFPKKGINQQIKNHYGQSRKSRISPEPIKVFGFRRRAVSAARTKNKGRKARVYP